MSLPAINQEYLVDFLVKLLNVTSPTGFAEPAIAFVEKELSQFSQLQLSRTRKGAVGRADQAGSGECVHVPEPRFPSDDVRRRVQGKAQRR